MQDGEAGTPEFNNTQIMCYIYRIYYRMGKVPLELDAPTAETKFRTDNQPHPPASRFLHNSRFKNHYSIVFIL